MLWTKAIVDEDLTKISSGTKKSNVPTPATAAISKINSKVSQKKFANQKEEDDKKKKDEKEDDHFSKTSSYVVLPWTRKGMRELRLISPPVKKTIPSSNKQKLLISSLSNNNNNNNNNEDSNNNNNEDDNKNEQNGASTSASNTSNTESNNTNTQLPSLASPLQWWSNNNVHDKLIMNVLNQITVWNNNNSVVKNTIKMNNRSYSGACPWIIHMDDVRRLLVPYKLSLETNRKIMLRVLLLIYTNHLIECVLPLIELWRNSTSLSASGWTPIASSSFGGGSTKNSHGWCPQPWSHGALLIRGKELILTASKLRLLCKVMTQTSTENKNNSLYTTNTKKDSIKGASKINKKLQKLMSIPKRTIELLHPFHKTIKNTSNNSNGMNRSGVRKDSYFEQCCHLFPTFSVASFRYGNGTCQTYGIQINYVDTKNATTTDVEKNKEMENDVLKYQNNHAYLLSEVSHEINKCPSMLSHLNLFIEGYGSTTEHPILIPRCCIYQNFEMDKKKKNELKTLGWLFGIALRTKTNFDIKFAPFMYTLLTNPTCDEFEMKELMCMDVGGALQYMNSELGEASVQIQEMGEEDPLEIRRQVLNVRLNRVRKVMNEIRSGLSDIIPLHTLAILTGEESKCLFAGEKERV